MRSADRLAWPSLVLGVATLCLSGCEVGGERPFSVIPGPTVPSAQPVGVPAVWDSREELEIWVTNTVTRGPVPISLVGDGVEAVIRIDLRRNVEGWVLRGPDLNPPQTARAVRIRYRWQLDPTLSPTAARTFSFQAIVEALNPPRPPDQPRAYANLQPADEWTTTDLGFAPANAPLEVKYVYLHQFSNNPGVFEIDRLELVPAGS